MVRRRKRESQSFLLCRKYSNGLRNTGRGQGSWWGVGVRGAHWEHDEVLPQNDDDLVSGI